MTTPATPEGSECDHEWEYRDDSFDHEYGTECIQYMECALCGLTKDVEPMDL